MIVKQCASSSVQPFFDHIKNSENKHKVMGHTVQYGYEKERVFKSLCVFIIFVWMRVVNTKKEFKWKHKMCLLNRGRSLVLFWFFFFIAASFRPDSIDPDFAMCICWTTPSLFQTAHPTSPPATARIPTSARATLQRVWRCWNHCIPTEGFLGHACPHAHARYMYSIIHGATSRGRGWHISTETLLCGLCHCIIATFTSECYY